MAAGTTKTELPRRGNVLRYVYLFHRESRDRDEGVKTSIPLHRRLLNEPDILNGDYSIKWLEDWLAREAAETG